jgi:hypothetical protein
MKVTFDPIVSSIKLFSEVNGSIWASLEPIKVASCPVKSSVSILHRFSAFMQILLALERSLLELYAFMKADNCSPDGVHESGKKMW